MINSLDNEELSPLALALLKEKFFSSRTLLSTGAKVNIGAGKYGSCLNITTTKISRFLVQDILKVGGDPN